MITSIPIESGNDQTVAKKHGGQLFDMEDVQIDLGTLEKLNDCPVDAYGTVYSRKPYWGHVWREESGNYRAQIRERGTTIAIYESESPEELLHHIHEEHECVS